MTKQFKIDRHLPRLGLQEGNNIVSNRPVDLTALPAMSKAVCDECGHGAHWSVRELSESFIVEGYLRPKQWFWCGLCETPTWRAGSKTPAHLRSIYDSV